MKKILGIIMVVVLALLGYVATMNVSVEVRNSSQTPITNVRVLVTGEEYELGELQVGESKEVIVEPLGESGVEMNFLVTSGEEVRSKKYHYFEGHSFYRGHVVFDVTGEKPEDIKHSGKISLFW